MILTSLQGRRLIEEIWTQKIGSSHFVWDACQDFSPSETKGFTNEFGEHLLWQHTQNSILVFIFSGKCSSPRDMVMWSKSSMYLYCGAYLFTASHHTRGECSNHFPLCMHISILFVVSSQVVHTCHQTFASQWNTFSCIAFILCTGNTLCHALPKP